MYAFTRVHKDYSVGWFLGMLNKKEYFDKAVFMKKGSLDPANGYTVRADCYNVPISELRQANGAKEG